MIAALLVLTTLLAPGADRAASLLREGAARAGQDLAQSIVRLQPAAPALYRAEARAVSNWREETREALRPVSLALVAFASPADPAFVARCVKLNNYWCIKRANWDGEIGADAEGHTGFASAGHGADAAVSLLRRYYTVLGRRSALAIVRRWAPAECGAPVAARPRGTPVTAPASPALAALAPQGIGRTVRARFLAGRGRGMPARRLAAKPGAARPTPAKPPTAPPVPAKTVQAESTQARPTRPRPAANSALRVQPWSALARLSGRPRRAARPLPLMATPSIATGLGTAEPRAISAAVTPGRVLDGERLAAEAAALPSLTSLTSVAALPPALRPPPPLCSSDETRIQNYAGRIAASVGLKAGDDLGLFDADGHATARLAPVLLAMSAVELGSLQASPALVAQAIARAEAARPGPAAPGQAAAAP
ncbi:hypothetical protein [Methylobacterium oryzisoli]|uniref:hypothetical protein n=1 Tax=Methylobacterium oryzisoli TaxID=3385502 RepID=UPI00389129AF